MQTVTQPEDLANYLTDASNMQGGHAERLLRPQSAEEISEMLAGAYASGTPVTISGARTGSVGGAIPFGGYLLSLEKLNKIKSIDTASMTAVVGAGVMLGDLAKAATDAGLFYPPDPTEWSCQVGGTVATNASGARSFKYGATRNYVTGLTVVLADGSILDLRRGEYIAGDDGILTIPRQHAEAITITVPTYERPRVRKNVSGYYNNAPVDAVDLFIGSEGTLGVIAEIELRLIDRPAGLFSGIVFFADDDGLQAFVREARELSFASRKGSVANTIDAALLEYFDDRALSFISDKFPETPKGMAGAIFFEQETTLDTEDVLFEQWNTLLERHGAELDRSWFTTNEQDRAKMQEFRHALPVAVNEVITRYGQRKVGTDMSVPDENFGSFLLYYKQLLDESGLDYVIFGHIGDCHLHANMLPKDVDEMLKAERIYGRCIAQAIMLGGTVSAEHGIGKLKRKYLAAMMGERYLNEMAEMKRAFDPKGILGRGNMFDEAYI